METKRQKKILNIVMIALIAIVVFCGIMAIGNIKGWFGDDGLATVKEVSGVANIERKGIAYTLEKGTAIKNKDVIETKSLSMVEVGEGKNLWKMNEESEILINIPKEKQLGIELNRGEIFSNIKKGGSFDEIKLGDSIILADDAIFSANIQTGSAGVNVFDGEVTIKNKDENKKIKSGQTVSITEDGIHISQLKITSLNDFNLSCVQDIKGENSLCFSDEEIEELIAERNKAKMVAEEEAKEGNKGAVKIETVPGKTNSSQSNQNVNTCTIQIRCDTILNNMEDLTPGKDRFVPANGVILATSSVEFKDGETVFDVLKRACAAGGISLEYSWTPMYGSYYIEGINNLYEFDCGEQSGWMYKVNGWFPNYGCSEYKLKDGDTIVWCYTCKGLGADVGGSVY